MRCKTNRGWTAGPLISGYGRTMWHASVTGVRRELDEINGHRLAVMRGTEFGLSPSQMKGAFGKTKAPFRLFGMAMRNIIKEMEADLALPFTRAIDRVNRVIG